MTEVSPFFDGQQTPASVYVDMVRAVVTSGVANGVLGGLVPTQGPGLGITVADGMAVPNGSPYKNTAPVFLPLAANGTGGNRVDRAVVRLNNTLAAVGTVVPTPALQIRLGTITGAAGGAVPALTQNSSVYEIPIARATVSSASAITSFTDERAFSGPGPHDIIAAHTAAGLSVGQVMQALTATTFGFSPLGLPSIPAITNMVVPPIGTNGAAVTSTTFVDVADCGAVINTNGASVVLLLGYVTFAYSIAAQFWVGVSVDGTDFLTSAPHGHATVGGLLVVPYFYIHSPTAGSHTYKFRCAAASGGTLTVSSTYRNMLAIEIRK